MRWTTHASAIADRYRAAVRGRAVGSVLAVERSVAVRAESKQLAKQLVAWPPLRRHLTTVSAVSSPSVGVKSFSREFIFRSVAVRFLYLAFA
jgi:hypothetical protein